MASASSASAIAVVRAKPLILTAADIFSAVRIGLLTGGGDCPGLNAVIRAVVRKGIDGHGHAIVGFRDGWRGPLENAYEELTIESTRGILPRGGTILRSSRTNPFKHDGGPERIAENMRSLNLEGLIAIGGEDTLGAAARLHGEYGLPVVGVPKTIDNDLGGTDMTFGFDTAVQIATEAIDRLHTTAESHNRVMIVEVMGRHAGWIALYSGLAGGADVILIPERPFDIEEVVRLIRRRHSRGRFFSIVVVAEGAVPVEGTLDRVGTARTGPSPVLAAEAGEKDEFGHRRLGGIGQLLERELGERTGFDTRATVLGHIQRGGTPTAFDRVLATRLGLAAIDAAHDRRWGVMPALIGTRIELVALGDAVAKLRLVPEEDYAAAAAFFG
jgi:ATP-dependent phosphofructokinase / diphosphate-dependent phosphofructokinase